MTQHFRCLEEQKRAVCTLVYVKLQLFHNYTRYYCSIHILSAALASHINISITTDSETVFAGQPFSLTCEIRQAEGLTSQQLTIEWLDSQRNPVNAGGSVSVLGPVRSGTRTTLTLEFDPLHLENSEEYGCFAVLTTPAPPFQFEREARLEVIVLGKCMRNNLFSACIAMLELVLVPDLPCTCKKKKQKTVGKSVPFFFSATAGRVWETMLKYVIHCV